MKMNEKAKRWRERMGLSVAQLEELSGFSREGIYHFERGHRSGGTPITEYAWHRYRMVCAAVEQQLKTGKEFDW